MNTMDDLKREVLTRLQHLDGRYIESLSTVSLPEMLGVIDVDEQYDTEDLKGTLLDPEHDFWDEYIRDLHTPMKVNEEVEVAIRLLRDEGRFRLREPDDKGLSGVSVEVAQVRRRSETGGFSLEVVEHNDTNATLRITTDNGVFETVLTRV